MKSCGRAKVDKLAISFMTKGRKEAGGDDWREEDKKRETVIVLSTGLSVLCPL
jgi:hypothetical protein